MCGFERFLNWAKEQNWSVKEIGAEKYELPEVYRGKIDEWEKITQMYEKIENADGTIHLVLGELLRCDPMVAKKYKIIWRGPSPDETDPEFDYDRLLNSDDDLPILWDTFKLISLDVAEPDKEEMETVEKWWDKHFPFLIYTGWEYEFYAVDVENGTVVNGFEPEFEDTEKVADSLNDFFEKIVSGDIIL